MFDCIIVGSGPAGASAAYHLAKRGRSVLILEKAELPRYKPCGGGVSPIVQSWFDFDFSPAISWKTKTNCYTWNQSEQVEVTIDNQEPIWMVRRDVFDFFLVQQAQRQGAQLRDNTKATAIAFKNDCWHITTSHRQFACATEEEQEPVTGRYLIAADGAKGIMSKLLGFPQGKTKLAGALEVEVPLAKQEDGRVYFEFGMVKGGYIWNFPKADGYSIGVGTFRGAQRQDFKAILTEYAGMFKVDINTGKQCGHPISLWNGNQKLHTDRAVLAGEAAAVVDPFTAEGIRPSMFSGIKAAEAIDKALAGDINALEGYTETMSQEWGGEMVWAKRLAEVFYRFPKVGYGVGVKRPSATATMYKILAGELGYSDVASKAIARMSQGWLN